PRNKRVTGGRVVDPSFDSQLGDYTMIKKIVLSLAGCAALTAGVAQAAGADYLIRIVGISGTSTIEGFEDYIAAESWSLGFTRGVCQDLHFVKQMDAASAPLTGATILGTFDSSIGVV